MAFATIQITQGATVGGSGESVISLVPGTDVTLTDDGGAGATSYLWEILQWPAPDTSAPTVNNSTSQVATVVAGAGLTDGVYIVRLTRDDPVDGVSTDVKFFAVADEDGLSLPSAGMNRTMSNVGGSSVAQDAGWFGSTAGGTHVFLDAYLRLLKTRSGQSKVSSNDTTFGLLEDKIVAGSGVAVQTLNDGGNESVEISLSGGSPLSLVIDTFTATGGDSGFTLSQAPNGDTAAMFVEGIGQQYNDDFTISGTALTYSGDQTLEAGQRVQVIYIVGSVGGATTQLHDLTHSPVALYQFEGDLTDSSGNGYDLTLESGSELYGSVAGLPCFYFDNASSVFRTAYDAALAITGAITVEMIVSLTPGTAGVLIDFSASGETEATNILYNLSVDTSNTLSTLWESGGGTNRQGSNVYVPSGVFHLAWTRDSAGTLSKIYINGAKVLEETLAGAASGGTSAQLRIGDSATGNPLGGYLASLKIVGSELSASEVLAEYERTLAPMFSGGAGGGGGVEESEITDSLTGSVNNYSPTGWDTATVVLLDADGDYNITGFDAAATVIRKTIFNVDSTNSITIPDRSASSSAANRVASGGIVLGPDDSIEIVYDSTNSLWRVV